MHTIYHDGSADYLSNVAPALGETVTVRLRTAAGTPVKRVILRTVHDGEQAFAEMRRSPAGPWAYWEGQIVVTEPKISYRFLVLAGDGQYFYNTQGLCAHEPLDLFDFKLLGSYQAPDWVTGSVFYQINPDTWRRGRPDLDLRPAEYDMHGHRPRLKKWGEPLQPGEPYAHSYYGGNLYGVADGLDYLQELGVSALYLNPIFTAFTTHRYDTADYRQVDPLLGGNQALAELSADLHRRGLRYLLDIVPNHCGLFHPWFLQAQADPDSPERGFFIFTRYPDEYRGWAGSRVLVKLNYADAELRRRVYEDRDSVLRFWLRPPYHADGWRVDVGNMLGRDGLVQMNHEVLRGMRRAVKDECPACYFMGENFLDATDQLQGDMWDGVMNYRGFFTPLVDWLTRFKRDALGFPGSVVGPAALSTAALVHTWRERLGAVPWAINLQQFNMLGSHDTERITTTLAGSEHLYWLAVRCQMTFPGVPCVYYGNEIGLRSPTEEPAARAGARTCMDWDRSRWDVDSFRRYQELIHLRRTRPALSDGGFQVLAAGQDGFIYQRQRGQDGVLFTANRSPDPWHPGVVDAVAAGWGPGTRLREFGGQRTVRVVDGQIDFPPLEQGGVIWLTE